MKVAIFGQRTIGNNEGDVRRIQELFDDYLAQVSEEQGLCITFLTGGANGPQQIVHEYLKDSYDFVVFKPWTQVSSKLEKAVLEGGKFDPVYFFYRNIQIVDNADVVVIFDNGEKDAEVYKVRSLCERKGKDIVNISLRS